METIAIDKNSKKIILSVDFDEVPCFSSALAISCVSYYERYSKCSDSLMKDIYYEIEEKHSSLRDKFISLSSICDEQK